MTLSDSADFKRNPRDFDALIARIRRLEDQQRLLTQHIFKNAGMSVSEGGLTVASGLAVSGDLSATGDTTISGDTAISGGTTIGGTLDVTAQTTIGGQLEVAGDATFLGDVDLPNGSITAANLATEVRGDAGNASVTGASVNTTMSNYATVSLTVPAGFTSMSVVGMSSLALQTTSLGASMLTRIGGNDGESMNVYPDTGNLANGSSNHARSGVSVTGGSTIQITTRVRVGSGTGIAIVTTAAMALFFR